MDVEQLQKVNQLAMDLKHHGLTPSMDDAYTTAGTLLGKDGGLSDVRNEPEQIDVTNDEPATAPVVENNVPVNNVDDAKIQKMEDVIMKMQHVMNDMLRDISELKNQNTVYRTEINNLRKENVPREVSHDTTPHSVNTQEAPKIVEQSPAPQPEAKKDSHPKQGQFTPETVKIEDFFYYGNK